MKTKVLALIAGSMMVSSLGFAAPISNVAPGDTTVGYSHYSLSHSNDNDEFYLEHALSDKFILGIQQNNNTVRGNGNGNTTDVYAQYKIDPNIRLILGNRNYDYAPVDNKVFYGIGANTNLGPKLDGYASVITSSATTEWQAGVNYALSEKVGLNLGYKSSKDKYYSTYDGIGIGVNYKF